MGSLFAFLLLFSLLGLIVGLIKPSIFKKIFKNKTNRKMVSLGFTELIILFIVLINVTVPSSQTGSSSGKSNTNKQANKTVVTGTSQTPAVNPNPQWAGYMKFGSGITGISGTWTVPTLLDAASSTHLKLGSIWIGIGGNGANSGELIQIGTDQVEGQGKAIYVPIWECYPEPGVYVSAMAINPGDTIQANIAKEGSVWSLDITDKTNGESFQKTKSCNANQSTAEWILEDAPPPYYDPSGGGPPPNLQPGSLPILSSFTFSNLTVNGKAPGLADEGILLITQGSQPVSAPSNLTGDGTVFTLKDIRQVIELENNIKQQLQSLNMKLSL